MSDSLPIKLSVRGRRIRHKKKRLEVTKIYRTHEVRGVECSVIQGTHLVVRCGDTILSFKFHLKPSVIVKLVGNFMHGKFLYQKRWRMGKMRYKLRVNKLLAFIALNQQFSIRHTYYHYSVTTGYALHIFVHGDLIFITSSFSTHHNCINWNFRLLS